MLIEFGIIIAMKLESPKVEIVPIPQISHTSEVQTPESIIRDVFGSDAPLMIKIAKCESHLQADNQNDHSTAAGLFQITRGTFKGTGKDWNKRYDAQENIEAAKIIFDDRGTQPWQASSDCWDY